MEQQVAELLILVAAAVVQKVIMVGLVPVALVWSLFVI
jgi:hypothetical protein